MKTLSQAKKGALWGVLLGFGAPAGSLFFRMIFFGELNSRWIWEEITRHGYYYGYMAILTPLVFGLFGAFLGHLHDKTAQQKKTLQSLATILESQSMSDDITGLYNHRHILEELDKEIERAKRHGRPLAGFMIDIDDFKRVNDTQGHLAGDMVLREMAMVLSRGVRKIDVLGRYGGDEFLVILPDATQESARIVAERIQQNVRCSNFRVQKTYWPLSVSIGLAFFEDLREVTPFSFIQKADEAMFSAKRLGKNRIASSQDVELQIW